jgi:hypothetical protein
MTKRPPGGLGVARVVGNENSPGASLLIQTTFLRLIIAAKPSRSCRGGHIGQDGRMEDDERRTLWRRCNERLKVRQQIALITRRIGLAT